MEVAHSVAANAGDTTVSIVSSLLNNGGEEFFFSCFL